MVYFKYFLCMYIYIFWYILAYFGIMKFIGGFILFIIIVIIIYLVYLFIKLGKNFICGLPIIGGMVCKCPTGTTLSKGSCWSCKSPQTPVFAGDITGPNACSVADIDADSWCQAATKNSKSQGDPDGHCITCPSGYTRTVYAWTNAEACNGGCANIYKPGSTVNGKQIGSEGGWRDDDYGKTQGQCWACPAGTIRTLDNITTSTACAKGWFNGKTYAIKLPTKDYINPLTTPSWIGPAVKTSPTL